MAVVALSRLGAALLRVSGCNPVQPWKCAVLWGVIGVLAGLAIGDVVLAIGCSR